MLADFIIESPVMMIIILAFLVNLPCGYIREQYRKFSFVWFFWIHASIPLIVYLRIQSGISSNFIPLTILAAVAGQIIGSRFRRYQQSNLQKNKDLS